MKAARDKAVNAYLDERAKLGQIHRNDRLSDDKKHADAILRGKLGCARANEVIAAIDNLRARGF